MKNKKLKKKQKTPKHKQRNLKGKEKTNKRKTTDAEGAMEIAYAGVYTGPPREIYVPKSRLLPCVTPLIPNPPGVEPRRRSFRLFCLNHGSLKNSVTELSLSMSELSFLTLEKKSKTFCDRSVKCMTEVAFYRQK